MKFYFVLDSSCMLIYDGAPSGAGGCGSSSVVEYNLAKVRVEGSNPFSRSFFFKFCDLWNGFLAARVE